MPDAHAAADEAHGLHVLEKLLERALLSARLVEHAELAFLARLPDDAHAEDARDLRDDWAHAPVAHEVVDALEREHEVRARSVTAQVMRQIIEVHVTLRKLVGMLREKFQLRAGRQGIKHEHLRLGVVEQVVLRGGLR